MDGYKPSILAKILAVGFIGLLASMGLLLYTLTLVDQGGVRAEDLLMSQLTFQRLLRQGEVVECTLKDGELRGFRRGMGNRRRPFVVQGTIPGSLKREILKRRIPFKQIQVKAEPGPNRMGVKPIQK